MEHKHSETNLQKSKSKIFAIFLLFPCSSLQLYSYYHLRLPMTTPNLLRPSCNSSSGTEKRILNHPGSEQWNLVPGMILTPANSKALHNSNSASTVGSVRKGWRLAQRKKAPLASNTWICSSSIMSQAFAYASASFFLCH